MQQQKPLEPAATSADSPSSLSLSLSLHKMSAKTGTQLPAMQAKLQPPPQLLSNNHQIPLLTHSSSTTIDAIWCEAMSRLPRGLQRCRWAAGVKYYSVRGNGRSRLMRAIVEGWSLIKCRETTSPANLQASRGLHFHLVSDVGPWHQISVSPNSVSLDLQFPQITSISSVPFAYVFNSHSHTMQ